MLASAPRSPGRALVCTVVNPSIPINAVAAPNRQAAKAAQIERLFRLDVEASAEVTRQQWERRGVAERAKEWFARRWEHLL